MAGPSDFEQLSARAKFERSFQNNPAANANDGYHKVPNRTPPPAPSFEPPKPQKISENSYTRQLRYDQGLTASRNLTDNPGFRNPNPMPTAIPTSTGTGIGSSLRGAGSTAAAGIAADAVARAFPGLLRYGPTYLDPRNPDSFFSGKPLPPQFTKSGEPVQDAIRRQNREALKNLGLPDWLNPLKDTSKNGDRIPEGQGKPNAESKKWFPTPNLIKFYSPNNRQEVTIGALSYSITAQPKYNQGTPENPIMSARFSGNVYRREGTDSYLITWTFFQSLNPVVIRTGNTVIEPWTIQNLGPNPAQTNPNPNGPENRVPETDQPFFPPLPNYLDELAKPYPPTILDPADFKPPANNQPLVPTFPPELAPIPKPLDPLQKPAPPLLPGTQPPKPDKDEETKIPPLFPFNPSPSPSNPTQNPPPFEPGPSNPNQRLNDRGIFPAQKATITPTVSGSPLSPDVEIGGDPVRLKPPPQITKPKPPFETDKEEKERQKREEEKKKSAFPLPIPPLIPPIFPRPAGPTGTIDPNTADDITKSKDPPKPPVGTKPKCQDPCMARLETGQQSILDKMGGAGGGLNVGLNAAELALLTTINSKVGDQVPGGLSGKLTRLSSWLHLDRALNLMIYANTLHNAYMLSSGLTQTLFGMIGNVLAAVGIKDAENNPFDIGAVLGKTVDNYAKGVLGVTTVDGIKAEWKKFSRIYAAAANVLFSLQSIGQSILGVLEIVGSNVAKIGNALTKFGAIGEKAFGKMNDTPHFQNRFFTALETVEQTTSQIDSIASEVLSTQDSFTQIKSQQTELENAMKQGEGSKQGKESPEAAAVKAAELAKKTTSQPPTIPVTAERKPEV